MKSRFTRVIFLCIHAAYADAQNFGLVISPVADLFGQPPAKNDQNYAHLPVAGSSHACPRIHQLLFNETVEIIKETAAEYCIRIPHMFYITKDNGEPQNIYWTDKRHIIPCKNLFKTNNATYIPKPINFRSSQKGPYSIVVLTKPWHAFDMTFSAGTRFIGKSTWHAYTVITYHPTRHETTTLKIPTSHAILECTRTPAEARKIYIKLLKSWAHTKGYIPYVWGGCSFSYTHLTGTPFCRRTCGTNHWYEIKNDTHTQKSGFDCAGLIARAAQIAGLPYYYKNTATLAAYLKPVTTIDELKDGDLIWIPGHVMAVGDIHKGTIIEARHYSQGYGKIHEIKLNKVFKDISNFQELFLALQKNIPLERLDNRGDVAQKIKELKILSIESPETSIQSSI